MTVLLLSLGFWFAWEWLLFAVRARVVVRQVRLHREVCDERGPVDSLWAGRAFTVRVEARLEERLGLSYVAAVDRVPFEATPDSLAAVPVRACTLINWLDVRMRNSEKTSSKAISRSLSMAISLWLGSDRDII